MLTYWHYWTQGWKFELVAFLSNLLVVLVVTPITIWFSLSEGELYFVVLLLFVFLIVPATGYLFCRFRPKPNPYQGDGASGAGKGNEDQTVPNH